MKIHTTLWSPTTCQCQVHYRWDEQEGHKLDGMMIRSNPKGGSHWHPREDREMSPEEIAQIVDTRRHAFHRFERKCTFHAVMTDAEVWSDIITHNPSTSWGNVPALVGCDDCISYHEGKA
jgi:hypothetical protein